MKLKKNKMMVLAGAVLSLILMSASPVSAKEEIKIIIDKVTVEDTVYTPYYHVDTELDHQQGSAQKWIRLGVYFTTEGGWIDELDITQMAMKPKVDGMKNVVLTDTVHYINLEPGDHKVYVYMHPSYVKRYSVDGFDLDVAAVISINGKEMARKETTKYCDDGWSALNDINVKKGFLLNHSETPFWFINYDFKEVIKIES